MPVRRSLVLIALAITTLAPAAGASFTLTPISTAFNQPIGVDYHEPTHEVLLSSNYPSGNPHTFELVALDGSHSQYSSVSGITDEIYIATVRSGSCMGGFVAGQAFTGNGFGGQILRISPDGSTVTNPWVTLPGESGLLRGGLFQDRYCAFGGDLIVSTTAGNVWRVTSAGVATQVATNVGSALEGPTTVPNDPTYGPWAGTILLADESNGCVYSVTTTGASQCWNFGIGGPEGVQIIPPNQNFFLVIYSASTLAGTPAADIAAAGIVGDVLVSVESGGGLYSVRWNGASFVPTLQAATGGSIEGMAFAPAGIRELPPPTPELSAIALSLAGVALVVVMARRR